MNNNRANQKFGRAKEAKAKFDWEKNGKPIALVVLLGVAFILILRAYINGPFSAVVDVVDPADDRAALSTFSTSIHIDKNAKLKVFDHFSVVIPTGYRGFIRAFHAQYGTESGVAVTPKLIESQYHDYVTPQFVPAYNEASGGGYNIYAGERESETVNNDTQRKYDLIASFDDAIGFTSKGDECIFWQITPLKTSVRTAQKFEILLPPGVGDKDFSYHFYRETLYPKSREELAPAAMKLKVTPARIEDTGADGLRLMITGTYEKPLTKNERLLVKLVWPKGFASKSVVIEATEPKEAVEAVPEVEESEPAMSKEE